MAENSTIKAEHVAEHVKVEGRGTEGDLKVKLEEDIMETDNASMPPKQRYFYPSRTLFATPEPPSPRPHVFSPSPHLCPSPEPQNSAPALKIKGNSECEETKPKKTSTKASKSKRTGKVQKKSSNYTTAAFKKIRKKQRKRDDIPARTEKLIHQVKDFPVGNEYLEMVHSFMKVVLREIGTTSYRWLFVLLERLERVEKAIQDSKA